MSLQGDDFWGGSFAVNHASGKLNPGFEVRWTRGIAGRYSAYIYLLGILIISLVIDTDTGEWHIAYA